VDKARCRSSRSSLKALLSLIALTLLAASGCRTYYIDTDYDVGTDFRELRSYQWGPQAPAEASDGEGAIDPRVANDLFDRRVRHAIDHKLADRGFREAEEGAEPDFLVYYNAAVEQRIDAQNIGPRFGWGYGRRGRFGGYGGFNYTVIRQYDVGTLMIDVVHPREQRLLWRGATQADIERAGTPEQRTQRIEAAVNAILQKFPPPGTYDEDDAPEN